MTSTGTPRTRVTKRQPKTTAAVRLESNKLADLLIAAEAIDALIRKHGIGDDDCESEPVVLALRAAIHKARE